jgi:DNA-binding response OmpR family regulator
MKKILVVDDEVMNRDIIVKVLSKEGMEVYEANNGQEALQQIKNISFDLILMDLMMPVMDGYETIEKIRHELTQEMPIITLSAVDDTASITRATNLGADNYLIKPYNLKTMVAVVKETLSCSTS